MPYPPLHHEERIVSHKKMTRGASPGYQQFITVVVIALSGAPLTPKLLNPNGKNSSLAPTIN
jgi:hypothetical protein